MTDTGNSPSLTVTGKYGGVTAALSRQLHVLYQDIGWEQLERHILDFSTQDTDVSFYPVTISEDTAISMTAYRLHDRIHAKTSGESYIPGTPPSLVMQHLKSMRNAATRMAGKGRTIILHDLRRAIDKEEERLQTGLYHFPYDKTMAIMDQLISFGLGPVTVRYTLETMAYDDPKFIRMMGLAGLQPPMATQNQIEAISQAAAKSGLHPEVSDLITTMLETGHQDNMLPTVSISPHQAEALRTSLEEAGFDEDHIRELLNDLKEPTTE